MGQLRDLLGGEESRFGPHLPRKLGPCRWVAGNATVGDSGVENRGERSVSLSNGSRTQALGDKVGDPRIDVRQRDLPQLPSAPPEHDVDADDPSVPGRGRDFEMRKSQSLLVSRFTRHDLRSRRLDVPAAVQVREHLVQPALGVDLPGEGLLPLSPRRVPPAGERTVVPRVSRDVRHLSSPGSAPSGERYRGHIAGDVQCGSLETLSPVTPPVERPYRHRQIGRDVTNSPQGVDYSTSM